MTLSLAAVFIPVFFMGGILGRLLHEFAVTIVAAILVSGLVSLTLTPMLCSRFLRPPREERHGRLYDLTERFFQGLLALYDRTLKWVLRRRRATMIVSVLLLILTGVLFLRIPKGFLPSEDQGSIFAFTEAAEGISFDAMLPAEAVAAIVAKNPYVDNFFSSIGAGVARTESPHPAVELDMNANRPGCVRLEVVNEPLAPSDELGPGGKRHRQLLGADRAHHDDRLADARGAQLGRLVDSGDRQATSSTG